MDLEQHDHAMQASCSHPPGLTINIQASGSNVNVPIIANSQTGDIQQNVLGASSSESRTDKTSVIAEYKTSILSEYSCTREYTSRPGENVRLSDRYVDPLIIQRHKEREEKEAEIRWKRNDLYKTKIHHIDQNISIDKLFVQENGPNSECPKAVILQGNSGCGKSITAQRIMLEWASGKLFAGSFDLVFHLRCAELSEFAGEISLLDLLSCSAEIAQILQNAPQRALFLVDGFDELRLSLPTNALPIRADIRAKPGAVLISLLKGRMLNRSFLLVTTRSVATENLGKILKRPQSFTEILGFSENGIQEYFQKFFEHKELSIKVLEHVRENETLYTACLSPVMCWLICTVCKEKSKVSEGKMSGFRSTTSVFVDFVSILLEHHCQGLDESQQRDLLKALGQLALDGISDGRVLFHRNTLPEVILNLSDSTSIPFLCSFQYTERIHVKEMFSFMHLIFQEFFAALFYTFLDETEAKAKIEELLSSLSDRENDHLLPIVQFLFGLSNKKASALLKEKFHLTVFRSQLEKWIYRFVSQHCIDSHSSFVLQCLFEIKDRNMAQKALKIWETTPSGIEIKLQSSDHHAAAFALHFCKSIRSLELCSSTMENVKMLQTALRKCERLALNVTCVPDDEVDCLVSAVGKGKDLQHLTVQAEAFSNQSVQMIMNTLHKQRSVGVFHLPVKTINYANAEIFIKSFKGNLEATVSLRANRLCWNNKENLCTCLTLSAHQTMTSISVQQGWLYSWGVHKEFRPTFQEIGFTCSSDFSVIDWKKFLQTSSNLKKGEDPEFYENVEALLGFLCSVPDLKAVSLKANILSWKCAAKILSFFFVRPVLERHSFRFEVTNLGAVDEEDIGWFSLSTVETRDLSKELLCLGLIPDWRFEKEDQRKKFSTPLRRVILEFPYVERSFVDWEDLLGILILKTKESEDPEFHEFGDALLAFLHSVPGLENMSLQVSTLCQKCTAKIISFCHVRPILKSGLLGFDVDSLTGREKEDICSLSLSMFKPRHMSDSLLRLDIESHVDRGTQRMESAPVSQNIILHFPVMDGAQMNWEHFLEMLEQKSTESCEEYDQCVAALLSVINTVPGLKELHLTLRFLTVDGAVSIMRFMQTCPCLLKVTVKVLSWPKTVSTSCSCFEEEIENYELDLCSELNVERNSRNELKLSLKCNSSNPNTKAALSYISLILTHFTEERDIDWRSFFQSYYKSKGFTQRFPDSDDSEVADKIMSFLHAVPGLEMVKLGVHSLTETWASRVLCLINANSSIHHIHLQLEEDDSESACSFLTIRRNLTDSTATIKIHKLDSTSAMPSHISFTVLHSEIPNIDGPELLSRMRFLNDTSYEYAEQINGLLSCIQAVPGLQKLQLEIGHLTESWATRILTFEKCPSLKKICVTTLKEHMLFEDSILKMKDSWKRRDCVLVMKGQRCSKSPTKCTEENWIQNNQQKCNKLVKLHFRGGSLSEVDGCCKTDSESEGEDYNHGFELNDDEEAMNWVFNRNRFRGKHT